MFYHALYAFALGGSLYQLSAAYPVGHAFSALAPLYVPPAAEQDLINGSYIVMFRDDVNPSAFSAHMSFLDYAKEASCAGTSDIALEHVYDSDIAKGYAGKLTPDVLEMIRARPEVKYVEQNQVVYADDVQKDPPWGLARINHRVKLRPGLSHYVYPRNSGAGVLVYVVDSGVYIEHHEFEGRARHGKTFYTEEGHTDGSGHGTHVAGTIASRAYGVAKKAEIVAVKVLNAKGSGNTGTTMSGLQWVLRDARARRGYKGFVVNMSLGGSRSRSAEDAANNAVKAGLHLVVAAGNDNIDACQHSPGSAALPITVGSSAKDDTRSSFSNYGECVDVFAPGSGIVSTGTSGRDSSSTKSGTSMATPHVAGLVAHFLSLYPHWSFHPHSMAEGSSFGSYFRSALAGLHDTLPDSLFGLLHSLPSLPHHDSMQAAPLSPSRMKDALLNLAVRGALVGHLPPGTPNLMVYNNYTHGQPKLWGEEPFILEDDCSEGSGFM